MTVSDHQPLAERRTSLPRDPHAAGKARRFVGALMGGSGALGEALDNSLLVATELVANAYVHGRGEIELRLSLFRDRLRIEVVDEGLDKAPSVREQPADETGGWGLRIVDQLALQWGVFEGTTHVWADIPLA